ncbi:hypothetical protein Nepgr_030089 [Nepenthes gracilis]|uniref:Uncharacterized protein n=1 Tax=Nepenthes gracilis TaxID=150966 RepID=A0AAD3Y678_NEPGR|nr:hypothetical protein Nepgr_030089 [Nepenthes gracilis]
MQSSISAGQSSFPQSAKERSPFYCPCIRRSRTLAHVYIIKAAAYHQETKGKTAKKHCLLQFNKSSSMLLGRADIAGKQINNAAPAIPATATINNQ